MSIPARQLAEDVPPLESGDHLTRAEFHAISLVHPEIKKADLIEGVVFVASPVRVRLHGEPHALAALWLGYYAALAPGLVVVDNATLIVDEDNEVQPDLAMFRSDAGGSAQVTDDDYLTGAPDLVVEIAASSASYDLHTKLRLYQRLGVPEYVVWRVRDRAIDWLRLLGGAYVRVEPDAREIIESERFPGLRLSVPAMLAFDGAGVLAALAGKAPDTPGDGGQ